MAGIYQMREAREISKKKKKIELFKKGFCNYLIILIKILLYIPLQVMVFLSCLFSA
jgi:hypothetical protein